MCIWKILYSFLWKCYGLLDSELPLTRYQPLKIQSFIIFLLTKQFFDISTLDISQTVTPKPMNYTIFWKNSERSFRCTFYMFCLNCHQCFSAISKKYKKCAIFFHFCISRSSKFSFMAVNMDIFFVYIKFANFCCITCTVPNLIPIRSWVYGLTWKTEYSKSNTI